jgi:hypothetical protein
MGVARISEFLESNRLPPTKIALTIWLTMKLTNWFEDWGRLPVLLKSSQALNRGQNRIPLLREGGEANGWSN